MKVLLVEPIHRWWRPCPKFLVKTITASMYYVSGVLKQVIDQEGQVISNKQKQKFIITHEELKAMQIMDQPQKITQLVKQISALKPDRKALAPTVITDWLVQKGFLYEEQRNNKKTRHVADLGEQLGMYEELRQGGHGEYHTIFYRGPGQQFIIDHLPDILEESISE